jgi:hypothetical protein
LRADLHDFDGYVVAGVLSRKLHHADLDETVRT